MKKILLTLIAVVILAWPALAYEVVVTDGFEKGDLSAWTAGSWGTMSVGKTSDGYQVRNGIYSLRQGNSTVDRVARDFRSAGAPWWYYRGLIEAWVYDDMTFSPADDLRVAAVSKGAVWTATNGPAGYIVAAVTNTSTGSWGSSVYYCYQWSYTQGKLDGVTLPSFANATFTMSTIAAVRSLGWHRFRVTWNFDYNAGLGTIKWYVDTTLAPKLTMDMSSACARWANTNNVAYAIIGNWSAVAHGYNYVDDFQFQGDPTPEPATLMTLGAGLLGLAGAVRRRRR